MLLAPNAEMVSGPAAIRGAFVAMGAMKPNLAIHPVKVVESGDVAYEYGRYELGFTGPDGKSGMEHGKYVNVWRRMSSGEWKLVIDTFNSSDPLPQ